jgi:hypothetical protein
MPSLVEGRSTCPLCGELLAIRGPGAVERPIESLSYVVVNQKDALVSLQDAFVHTKCLDADPRSRRAREVRTALARARQGPRRCAVCGQEAERPQAFWTGLVTSDSSELLWRANYQLLHKGCFPLWELAPPLRAHCRSTQWAGPALLESPHVHWDPRWSPPGRPFTDRVIVRREKAGA